ncbi:MAG: hypothetical protein ACYTG0_29260, partial [Planctomycetota bacterium]
MAPADNPYGNPGVESNASTALEHTFVGPYEAVEYEITQLAEDSWTHVRVYRRDITAGRVEATWRFLVQFSKFGTQLEQVSPTVYRLIIDSTAGDPPSEATANAFDYAPVRNYPPQKMHYFVEFSGRGYYANNAEPYVYYTDVVNVASGGNFESISGEYLPIFSEPISLLATYFGQLIIGTPSGLNLMSGVLVTPTNKTTALGESVPAGSESIQEITCDGPVRHGTGDFIVADNIFYYISERGLMRYDGRDVHNVTLAIAKELEDFSGELPGGLPAVPSPIPEGESIFTGAQLAHDPVRHIIYLLVRRPTTINDAFGWELDSTLTLGRIWCYHYRNTDPETGFGHWTTFFQAGPGSTSQRDRTSAIDVRVPTTGEPRLAIAANHDLAYREAVYVEQQADHTWRFKDQYPVSITP